MSSDPLKQPDNEDAVAPRQLHKNLQRVFIFCPIALQQHRYLQVFMQLSRA